MPWFFKDGTPHSGGTHELVGQNIQRQNTHSSVYAFSLD